MGPETANVTAADAGVKAGRERGPPGPLDRAAYRPVTRPSAPPGSERPAAHSLSDIGSGRPGVRAGATSPCSDAPQPAPPDRP